MWSGWSLIVFIIANSRCKCKRRFFLAIPARTRLGPRPKRLLRATPSQICAEAPAAKRLGVPSLPSRGCAEGTLARPQRGNPKGGAALFGQSLPTFCWPESRGPARPERVEGKSEIFKKRKENKKAPGAAAPPIPRCLAEFDRFCYTECRERTTGNRVAASFICG